jgi:transcriptional regulator with XRE-family HTH domain
MLYCRPMRKTIVPKTILRRIGKRLKERRLERGFDRRVFAQKVDIHETTIYRIEHGRMDYKFSTFYRLAKELKIPMHELLQ